MPFFRASPSIPFPRAYYDQGVVAWVLEMICMRLRRLKILSKPSPPSPSAAEGTVFPHPVSAPAPMPKIGSCRPGMGSPKFVICLFSLNLDNDNLQ